MKSETAIQVWHDRLSAIVLRETPIELSSADRQRATAALDVMCWMLGHAHNRSTELAMARLLADMHDREIFASRTCPAPNHEIAGLLEAGERFIILRGLGEKPFGIQCTTCGAVSHNQNDIFNLYCGNCHVFHCDEEAKALADLEKWGAENTIEGRKLNGGNAP